MLVKRNGKGGAKGTFTSLERSKGFNEFIGTCHVFLLSLVIVFRGMSVK